VFVSGGSVYSSPRSRRKQSAWFGLRLFHSRLFVLSELKTNLVWFGVSPSFIGSVPILVACPLDRILARWDSKASQDNTSLLWNKCFYSCLKRTTIICSTVFIPVWISLETRFQWTNWIHLILALEGFRLGLKPLETNGPLGINFTWKIHRHTLYLCFDRQQRISKGERWYHGLEDLRIESKLLRSNRYIRLIY
jgi:hypothetical protein